MSENEKGKSDWSVIESVTQKQKQPEQLVPAEIANLASHDSVVSQKMAEQGEEPQGILARFQQGRLSRKASLEAMKLKYDSQIKALGHNLAKACQVEKAKADVMADEYLKELDAQHLQVLSRLGLRNKETREKALMELTQSTVDRLKEVQQMDWPPSMIEETINDLLELKKRAVADIMNELGAS